MRRFLVNHVFLGLLFFLFLSDAVANTKREKTIVTSIRPLTLLLNELALPSDKLVQLVKNSNSAHHYQLKVSDRRLMQSADILFWVGPELEVFLNKPLKQVRRSKPESISTLSQLENLTWPVTTHKNHNHEGHSHDRDPHIWLNPINLQVIVLEVTKRLSQLSPENSHIYKKKADILIKQLMELDTDLKAQLAKLADKPFVVLHPAYTHFVERYKLNQIDYVGINPDAPIGAKHLYTLGQYDLRCIFGEAGQNHQHIEKIATLSNTKVGYLDPLGLNLASDAGIVDLVRQLANDLEACLR